MEAFTIKNLTFTYPHRKEAALKDINLSVSRGAFIVICGQSGSGKTTLLRKLKGALAPAGESRGDILFYGVPLDQVPQRDQARKIGYVLQNPDNQIVTDKVWHELAFGMESLGYDQETIRLRVAEMASFFGIQSWFHKNVQELSGGQKQILNLASVMALQPEVLILDEPTSQLDPIAARDFLAMVEKIHREIGVTVLLSEHRLDEVMAMGDRVWVLDNGQILVNDTPENTSAILATKDHPMFLAMPAPLKIYGELYEEGFRKDLPCPVTVGEGRKWLEDVMKDKEPEPKAISIELPPNRGKESPLISMKDVWFRYEKREPDVIKDFSMEVFRGEFFCIVGGNGTGKTTALNIISGLKEPYRGGVKFKGRDLGDYKRRELFSGIMGVLPQNPQSVFVKASVGEDLEEMLLGSKEFLDPKARKSRVLEIARQIHLEDLMDVHPYDLSGGEQQRAALGKILLMEPEILLLDEPTKGMDSQFKEELAQILRQRIAEGITVILVSHDIEFCAQYGDRCAMIFDGNIITQGMPRQFFSGNSFYTTAANRMSRQVFENAVVPQDVVALIRANFNLKTPENKKTSQEADSSKEDLSADEGVSKEADELSENKLTPNDKDFAGFEKSVNEKESSVVEMASKGIDFRVTDQTSQRGHLVEKRIICKSGKPIRKKDIKVKDKIEVNPGLSLGKTSQKAKILTWIFLALIPITLYLGTFWLDDRKYYIISLLVVGYTMIPFFAIFEGRKPMAREVILISVLITLGVLGRGAFFMIPQFKPIIAIVILAGVTLGSQAGFMTGAMTAFVSNFFFGQGPWTPWQMFALGLIGFLAGWLVEKRILGESKTALMIFGAIVSFVVYGFVVDLWTVFGMGTGENLWQWALTVYTLALPFNIINTVATSIFLFFLAKPMVEKINRIKIKYGMIY
ncbi:MAG: energy-coupling factor transporter ATPase [Anaerovoracaceae bacterium]|jgi:energy-coupling factor transport system ATP-binding protein|nr:energy-coupling factor transporter ATPase [Anaerovoracaceae bacterium]